MRDSVCGVSDERGEEPASAEEAAPSSRLGALAFRDFRFYWTHGLLQGIARNMRDMLTFYLVYDLSGSALQLGITGLFQGAPIILFGLVGGALADALNRKTLLIVSQAANLVSMLALTALVFTGLVESWHLWLFASFWSAANALGRPAQRAYLPRLVPRAHVMNAITWFGALSQGTLFAGPILGGLLIAFVGVGWAYAANSTLLFVVTEAHAMKPAFEEALKRLNPSRVLLTGNALSSNGEFYESHRAKRGNYRRVRISAYDTPAFTGENIDVPGLMTETDIAEREDDYGRDHPLFMAGVLALFPDAQDDSLVGRQAVEDAMTPSAPSGDGAPTEEEDAREPVYVGVDVARFGFDKSALVARRGQRVVDSKTFAKMDTMRLAFEAAEMAREWRADAVFVDETGVGGGVVDRLRELGAPVYGVQFGGKPLRRARFANLRSEIFWELRRLMNDRLIALPPDDALAGQLLSFRYDVSSSGQVRLESKKAMRGRGLPSPDKADALAMAFMRPPSLQIWTGNEPFLRPPRAPAGVPLPPPTLDDDDGAPGATDPDPPGGDDGGDAPPIDKYPLPPGEGQGEGRPADRDGGAAPSYDRHSRVGGNPVGAQAPRRGATRPVPEDPTARSPDRESRNLPTPPADDGPAPSPILVGW